MDSNILNLTRKLIIVRALTLKYIYQKNIYIYRNVCNACNDVMYVMCVMHVMTALVHITHYTDYVILPWGECNVMRLSDE